MTAAELVRGQNHPLPVTRLEIRVSAGTALLAGTASGKDIALSPRPVRDHRLPVDLTALPEHVEQVDVLLVLPPGEAADAPFRFGAVAAPSVTVTGAEGTRIANYTLTGLDAESAVIALELYRRQGGWKVRAVGQGYAGGLAQLLRDRDVPQAEADAEALAVARALTDGPAQEPPAPPGDGGVDYRHPRRGAAAPGSFPQDRPPADGPPGAPRPVAGDAAGWTVQERLHNQVWGMFEDLARTVAAYRGAVEFAESRLEQETDRALSDPRTRVGPAAAAAREQAQARQKDLIDQARAVLDRDLAQLMAESEVVEPALPPAFARWDSPVWHGYTVPMEVPMAIRVGDLHLPEDPALRIPMLIRLPLERGLWVDSAGNGRRALDVAVALAARLLAAYPAGDLTVRVLDPAGSAAEALAPLTASGALRGPPAVGEKAVAEAVGGLTQRVDLLQMAMNAGAADALPPELDPARQLLVVAGFPYGFDDRAITRLRYLADEGPSAGVHLLLVADRQDAREYGPVLDPLWRSLLRLTPAPDDHLADPWVGHAWTYEPLPAPPGSRVLPDVLRQVAAARQAYGL